MSFLKPIQPAEEPKPEAAKPEEKAEVKSPAAEEPVDWYMKVWQALEGEKRNGIYPENLKIFTAAIMKILLSEGTATAAASKYGAFTEDGKLALTQQQATKIHKDFILLYLNRTAYNNPTTTKVTDSEYTFKPSLCELSVSIVNSSRVKQAPSKDAPAAAPAATDPAKAEPTAEHVEQLIQKKERQEAYRFFNATNHPNRKLRKKKEEYEQSKKAECTFKPQITEYVPDATVEPPKKTAKHVKVSTSKSTADRCQALYELAKKIVKKEDKPTDDYIYEKEKDQYTFAPNISKEKKVEPVPAPVNDPLVGETIERLKKGREERERIKKGTERGIEDSGMRFDMETNKFKKSTVAEHSKQISSTYSATEPKTGKKDSGRKKEPSVAQPEPAAAPRSELALSPGGVEKSAEKPEEKPVPDSASKQEEKLYIDVNLGENVERIVVHKGDTAEGLATRFAEEHRIEFYFL